MRLRTVKNKIVLNIYETIYSLIIWLKFSVFFCYCKLKLFIFVIFITVNSVK